MTVDEWLRKKGAVELLCVVDVDGSRFGDLVEAVSISRPTVILRLKQARSAQLVKQRAIDGERGTTHVWGLTDQGATLRIEMLDNGTTKAFEKLKDARQEFAQCRESVLEWAADHPGAFPTNKVRPSTIGSPRMELKLRELEEADLDITTEALPHDEPDEKSEQS